MRMSGPTTGVRRPENRYLQDRGSSSAAKAMAAWGSTPAQDALRSEAGRHPGPYARASRLDRHHVIIRVRKALLKPSKHMQTAAAKRHGCSAAPRTTRSLISSASGYIEDDEDGPSFCRRVLASRRRQSRTWHWSALHSTSHGPAQISHEIDMDRASLPKASPASGNG